MSDEENKPESGDHQQMESEGALNNGEKSPVASETDAGGDKPTAQPQIEKIEDNMETTEKSAKEVEKDVPDNSSPQKPETSEKTSESESSPQKSAPKPRGRKRKEEKKSEESAETDEKESSDEPKIALLERSPVLESGTKRERKKVERIKMDAPVGKDKSKPEIEEGSGTKLGDIPNVEFKVNKIRSEELKTLHRILFGRAGSVNEIKKNIRKFSGFTFSKDSPEHQKKKTALEKLNLSELKVICDVLDLEKSGTKDVVVTRVLDFLYAPRSSGKGLPSKKRKRSSGKGKKRKPQAKKGATKKRPSKAKDEDTDDEEKDEEEEEREEREEGDSDEEEETAESEQSEQNESDEEEVEEQEDSDYEEAPKKKRARKDSGRKAAAKSTPKKPAKKETPKKEKKETSPKKASPKKAAEKKPKKRVIESDDDDSSDDEPLIAKKKPPTDDALRDVIKKILDTADLAEVTMKTVCKSVYAKYPDFDLTSRKDFIKGVVKQIIK